MRPRISLLALGWLCGATWASSAATVQVKPTESLSSLGEKLANDATITEVIFEEGIYFGGLDVRGPKGTELKPLLIRAADGARVLFDGSERVEGLQPEPEVGGVSGVFSMNYTHRGGEYPKLWEPGTRRRYRLVADRQAVARFPATYTIEALAHGRQRLLFHTSDGQAPPSGVPLRSAHDSGLFINRSNVAVRGIGFRNYVARDKWSTGIDLRADHIGVENCAATNCSMGFVLTGNHNAVRGCTTDDVGGGVYVGGANATIENCRFYKQRDTFMVPMYSQDDTGIQFYVPARGGLIRGNLCEGFGMGVFIKAHTAPYVVEHNTLVGLGQGLGFGSTSWHPEQRFRYNIIADCARQVEISAGKDNLRQDVDYNCYWSPSRSDLKKIGPNDMVADPKFAWPEWKDYRLALNSPCLKLADETGPCGAFASLPSSSLHEPESGFVAAQGLVQTRFMASTHVQFLEVFPFHEPERPTPFLSTAVSGGEGVRRTGEGEVQGPLRVWHVSENGRDGREGSTEQPVRTIQFAVDRARPGDTIVVHPGLYPEPVRITRGGTKDRPIVLRAAERGQAILDSNREASTMIHIDKAPYLEIHDLEIRWYGSVGIRIEESPHVTVAGCRVWNAHWHGAWPTGTGVRATRSPGFTGRHNILFQQEHGFWFYHSPNATLLNNTCAANLYSAAAFYYSCEGSVCRNNSFAFQGNDVIVIEENVGQKSKLKTFDCDYNNFGTALREQPAGTVFDSVTPRQQEPHFQGWSKAIVNYSEYKGPGKRYVSMAEWRQFSGLDGHTLIADPLYLNSAARDFRLDPKSPNRGAGAGGATIGALED